jgi:hypothetical protein
MRKARKEALLTKVHIFFIPALRSSFLSLRPLREKNLTTMGTKETQGSQRLDWYSLCS